MAYTLTYFDEEENDVAAAKLYYRASSEGLEKCFANAIELAILKLQQWPAAYAIRYKNVRIAYPVIFPYAIHFYIDENKTASLLPQSFLQAETQKLQKPEYKKPPACYKLMVLQILFPLVTHGTGNPNAQSYASFQRLIAIALRLSEYT